MKQGIGLAALLAAGLLFGALPAMAACPNHRMDGQSISVTGRISKIEQAALTYGDGTVSTHTIEIKECSTLLILAKSPKGCKVGSTVKAAGDFYFCDEMSFDFDECDTDELDSVSLTCR